MRTQRVLVAGLLAILVAFSVPSAISAQTSSGDAKRAENVKSRIAKLSIGRKSRLDVKTYDDHEIVGWLSDRHEDDFVVTNDFGDVKTIRYADVKKLAGKDMSTGVKILLGAGIAAGLLFVLAAIANHYGD